MGTFKRDYLGAAELRDAESVLTQLAGWFEDNSQAPHSSLGMRSPREYRAGALTSSLKITSSPSAPPYLAQDARSAGDPLPGYPPKIGLDAIDAKR